MRSMLPRWVVLAGAFLLVSGAAANAAAENVERVKVPFSFVVNGRRLPAGQYMIERDSMSPSVLLIRGEKDDHVATFVLTMAASGHDPAGTAPALVFTRDENQYRLSGVWESDGEGWSVVGR